MNIKYELIELPNDFSFALCDMNLPPFYSMEEEFHWHDCFEISYAKEGLGYYEINQQTYSLNKGELIIINNVEPHRMYVGEKGLNQFVITFNPSFVWSGSKNLLDYEYIRAFVDRQHGFCNKISENDLCFKEINSIILEIWREYIDKNEGWQLMIKAKLLLLLTLLYRHFKADRKTGVTRKDFIRLRPVLHKIEEKLSENISAIEMAKLINITPQHFSVLFKQTMGQTFVDYVNSKRIEIVKQKLLDTDKGITQIAQDCGFNNLSYFNKCFLEKTGNTPTGYRKQQI